MAWPLCSGTPAGRGDRRFSRYAPEPAGTLARGGAGRPPETLRRLSRPKGPEGGAGPDLDGGHRPWRPPRGGRVPGGARGQPALADGPDREDAAGRPAPRAGAPYPAPVDRGGGARAGRGRRGRLGLTPGPAAGPRRVPGP